MKSKTGVTPFITLCGDAEEAIHFYLSLFKDSKVRHSCSWILQKRMGPEPIMNLRKVAWVTDRFNITWQLVWA